MEVRYLSKIGLPVLVLLFSQTVQTAFAQDSVEFFDSFSKDSISYLIDERPDDRANRSYNVTPDGVEMRVSATGDDRAGASIHIADDTDTVRYRFSLSSETDIPVDDNGDVRIRLEGTWYNEIQDGGFGDGDRTGDVYIQSRFRLRGPEQREFSICVDRELEDGSNEGVLIFDGRNCLSMPNFEPELDRVYEAYVALDREAATIEFGIDDQKVITDIGQPVYLPSITEKRISVTHQGSTGQAVGFVSAIGTDGDLQVFSESQLTMGPYRPLFDLQQEPISLTVDEGRARFEATASADESKRLGLTVFGTSNKIEGTIELSSESVLANDDEAFSQMRLGGTFYNDTADGGFNDNEGNVFAAITLKTTPSDVHTLFYCLYRSNTADFSDATELVMQDGSECGDFDVVPELDTPYSVGINTDIEGGTVTFTVDDVERVHTITTAAFAPDAGQQFISAQARASAGSTVVAFLDDYRTSADAPLVAAETVSSGSSGCSFVGARGATDWTFLLMGLLAFSSCMYRRRRSD